MNINIILIKSINDFKIIQLRTVEQSFTCGLNLIGACRCQCSSVIDVGEDFGHLKLFASTANLFINKLERQKETESR